MTTTIGRIAPYSPSPQVPALYLDGADLPSITFAEKDTLADIAVQLAPYGYTVHADASVTRARSQLSPAAAAMPSGDTAKPAEDVLAPHSVSRAVA